MINTQIERLDSVIDTLKTQLDVLIKTRNELTGENKTIDTIITSTFHCCDCNITLKSKCSLDKHVLTKKHLKKAGMNGTKCRACNNTFYDKDITNHSEDGRCAKSRTCNGCNVLFDNMMCKSRHICSEKYGKKNYKITKSPVPVPKEIIKSDVIAATTLPTTKKATNDLFALPDKTYELNPLPDYCDNITESWFLDLHREMGTSHHCWEGVTYRASAFFGDKDQMEEFPMYSKGNRIYYVDGNELAFEIEDKGYYYVLIEKYVDVEAQQAQKEYEERADIYEDAEEDKDKFLYELVETEANFNVESYINLHKTEPTCEKFIENCQDIEDTQYQDRHYMYYSEGYLMRNDEPIFKIVKAFGNTMYDIIPIEDNISDEYNTDSSVNSVDVKVV